MFQFKSKSKIIGRLPTKNTNMNNCSVDIQFKFELFQKFWMVLLAVGGIAGSGKG